VLNGGSSVMESATIPWRWFFSDAAIEQQPTHILVIDQKDWEVKESDGSMRGERKIIPISRGSDFIQFTSPGRHQLTFIALKDPARTKDEKERNKFDEWVNYFLELSERGKYKNSLGLERTRKESRLDGDYDCPILVVAMEIVEVDVPQEFFAEIPQVGIKRAIWNWANRWFEYGPRDECSYRKRLIWAFTVQLPMMLIGHLLKYAYAIVCSIYLPIARIAVFYAGYRPVFLFAGIPDLWAWKFEPNEVDWTMRKYRYDGYSVWKYEHDEPKHMPITLFELTMLGVSGFLFCVGIYGFFRSGKAIEYVIMTIIVFVASVILFGVLSGAKLITRTKWWPKLSMWASRHLSESRKTKKPTKAPEPRPDFYFEWLKKVTHVSNAPQRVTVNDLPDAFRGVGIQRLRIKFWAKKSQICRPYSQ